MRETHLIGLFPELVLYLKQMILYSPNSMMIRMCIFGEVFFPAQLFFVLQFLHLLFDGGFVSIRSDSFQFEICVLPNPTVFLLLFSYKHNCINQYVFAFLLVLLVQGADGAGEIESALSLSSHESQQHVLFASTVDRLQRKTCIAQYTILSPQLINPTISLSY